MNHPCYLYVVTLGHYTSCVEHPSFIVGGKTILPLHKSKYIDSTMLTDLVPFLLETIHLIPPLYVCTCICVLHLSLSLSLPLSLTHTHAQVLNS